MCINVRVIGNELPDTLSACSQCEKCITFIAS